MEVLLSFDGDVDVDEGGIPHPLSPCAVTEAPAPTLHRRSHKASRKKTKQKNREVGGEGE
jgi:hypothetical protein